MLSSGKRQINLRVVGAAFALQAVMALLVLRTDFGVSAIKFLSDGVIALLDYSVAGIETLFGPMDANPFANTFLIAALPVIVFFAALVSILYYLGIMQRLVRWLGGAIGWLTGISKVEALGAAANIFVGQSESPLVVRPYLAALPPSRLFTLMCVGMAGVAGTILAAYAAFLGSDAVPYLLAAAFMSAPGGILMAKIIMPDDPEEAAEHDKQLADITVAETFEEGEKPANIIEAAAQGTTTGVKLAVAVGAMVMVFVALVALANGLLGGVGSGIVWSAASIGMPFSEANVEWLNNISFQQLLGNVFAPVMFLIGISDWEQAQIAGGLFGTKIVLNEFVAFIELGAVEGLTARTRSILTFAL
ncbi:MAG: nucleoside transporter C-terminal domain-containing protein, partial [Marinomonas sp.]